MEIVSKHLNKIWDVTIIHNSQTMELSVQEGKDGIFRTDRSYREADFLGYGDTIEKSIKDFIQKNSYLF